MSPFSGIRIYHKIISLMIGLVMGFVLMGVAYYAQISADIKVAEVNQQGDTANQLLDQLQQSAAAMSQSAIAWHTTGETRQLNAHQSEYSLFEQHIAALGGMDMRYVNRALLADITTAGAELNALARSIDARARVEQAADGLNDQLAAYQAFLHDNVSQRLDLAATERTIAQAVFATVLLITAIGTTAGVYLIYRSIVLPLWHIQSVIAQQNRGNDQARVSLTTQDELGTLGRAFNRLLDERIQVLQNQARENEQLNKSIITLIKSLAMIAKKDLTVKVPVSADVTGTVSDAVNLFTSETARTLHQVTGISAQVDRISDQLQEQSREVMQVAELEHQQVADTTRSLEELAKAMNDIAQEARTTNHIAKTTIEHTLKAQESVTQTVSGIQTIRGTIAETEKRIKRLGDRSQEITSIVNLINTIAERTHILALNASMHAASAGEAGKGFAVVAEEVQRLAENARSATSDISSMVNNIRVETSDTVAIMNKLITQVADGTRMAEDSGQRMHDTEAATRQLVNHVKSIAVNSINQANNAGRVRDGANAISHSADITHSKLQEQQRQTDELKACARTLVDRVQVFTLPEFRAEAEQAVDLVRQPAINHDKIPATA